MRTGIMVFRCDEETLRKLVAEVRDQYPLTLLELARQRGILAEKMLAMSDLVPIEEIEPKEYAVMGLGIGMKAPDPLGGWIEGHGDITFSRWKFDDKKKTFLRVVKKRCIGNMKDPTGGVSPLIDVRRKMK